MIHVDRESIPKPEFWDSPEFQNFLKVWCRFHGEQGGSRGTQERMPFASMLDRYKQLALRPLLEAFHYKCAYSEQKIDEKRGVVVFHRPLNDASDTDGKIYPDHYWWSLGDWSNWLPASRDLEISKGTLFPVAGDRMGPPPSDSDLTSTWIDENRDFGMLLDPSRDYPSWYLEFLDDGRVRTRSHPRQGKEPLKGWALRGELTIEILSLNRAQLVSRRQAAWRESPFSAAQLIPDLLRADTETGLPPVLRGTADPEFATALKQLAARSFFSWTQDNLLTILHSAEARFWIEVLAEELAVEFCVDPSRRAQKMLVDDPSPLWRPVKDVIKREFPDLSSDRNLSSNRGGQAFSISEVSPLAKEESDADFVDSPGTTSSAGALNLSRSAESSERVIGRTARVTAVEIRCFKAIEHLKLEIPGAAVEIPPRYGLNESAQTGVGWTVFLGENGSGKSCCLQALGLALAGDRLDDLLTSAGLKWKKLLRRDTDQGEIIVDFSDGVRAHLKFDDEKHWWLSGTHRMGGFVRGYGATRLLDGGSETADGANVRLANLFDAKAPVLDAERWLLDIEDEGDFNVGALTLAEFLGAETFQLGAPTRKAEPEKYIQRDLTRGEVTAGGDPLSYASDGYRAVVALVCDIMAGLGVGFSDLRNAPGIVLIDELGAHLHPRWKMEITSRLRREFPQIQFFVSTHEPLCLRGLHKNEVIRVRKERPEGAEKTAFTGRVTLEPIGRSPSDFRIDQLLTSEFFGLDATIDPDLDRQFQAYYRLLAMDEEDRKAKNVPWKTNTTLQQEFEELRATLNDKAKPALGTTRRDRLAYEAIDEYLSREKNLSPDQRRKQRADIIDNLQKIWRPPQSLMNLPKKP